MRLRGQVFRCTVYVDAQGFAVALSHPETGGDDERGLLRDDEAGLLRRDVDEARPGDDEVRDELGLDSRAEAAPLLGAPAAFVPARPLRCEVALDDLPGSASCS